jgi:hypothetical protein
MAQFVLGSFTFATKGDAVKSVQHILHNAPVGELLDGADLELVSAVINHHPDREEKLAGGMVSVKVLMNNEGYLARGFHVVRPDGSTASFSYRVALGQAPRTPTVQQACRMAVLPDIRAYRDARLAEGLQRCDVSGEPLTPFNTHVDHAGEWPFRRIVKEFVEWAVRERRSLRLIKREICIVEFADPQMTEDFRTFHNARAESRLVTQEVNQRWEREPGAAKFVVKRNGSDRAPEDEEVDEFEALNAAMAKYDAGEGL